jgi:hypothetical protein
MVGRFSKGIKVVKIPWRMPRKISRLPLRGQEKQPDGSTA